MTAIARARRHGWLGPVQPVDPINRTLPLFPEPNELPERERDDPNEARDLVMQVYWSAANEMLALGWAARRARSPEHRRALLELHDIEKRRKDLARLLLESLWGIYFKVPREPGPHHINLSA
jgi:hypothetical protein